MAKVSVCITVLDIVYVLEFLNISDCRFTTLDITLVVYIVFKKIRVKCLVGPCGLQKFQTWS
ncbi:hypothetical protein Hanom_Chr10g00953861 [Helianthus anomalus]